MRNQILKTQMQYLKIIDSGKIKDEKKKDAMKMMLAKLAHQLKYL